MLRSHPLRLAVLAVLSLSLSGCANKKKTGQDYGSTTDSDSVNGTSITGTPLPERQEGVSFLGSNVDRTRFSPIHFGFDSFTVSDSERGKIHQVAEFMKSSSNTIILAGFTDERGTPEYNRGLGERRAQAVREALIRQGGSANRLQTVSFGSEMPAGSGSGEAAWAADRRAEFGVVR